MNIYHILRFARLFGRINIFVGIAILVVGTLYPNNTLIFLDIPVFHLKHSLTHSFFDRYHDNSYSKAIINPSSSVIYRDDVLFVICSASTLDFSSHLYISDSEPKFDKTCYSIKSNAHIYPGEIINISTKADADIVLFDSRISIFNLSFVAKIIQLFYIAVLAIMASGLIYLPFMTAIEVEESVKHLKTIWIPIISILFILLSIRHELSQYTIGTLPLLSIIWFTTKLFVIVYIFIFFHFGMYYVGRELLSEFNIKIPIVFRITLLFPASIFLYYAFLYVVLNLIPYLIFSVISIIANILHIYSISKSFDFVFGL